MLANQIYYVGGAAMILLHHIVQFCPHRINVPSFGHLAVALFFLLSGYGLEEQVKNDEAYLRGFLSKHIIKIYVPYLIATIIYIIARAFLGLRYTVANILLSLVGYMTIVNFSWYIFALLILYFIFEIVYMHFSDINKRLAYLSFAVVMLILFSVVVRLPSYWYVSLLAFPFGVFVSAWQGSILHMTKNNRLYFLVLVVLSSVCMLCWFGCFSKWCTAGFEAHIIVSMVERAEIVLCDMSFIGACVLICCKCHPRVVLLSKMGDISYEVYLFQGLFVKLFAETLMLNSNISYIVAVTVCTLLFSIVIHKPIKIMLKFCEQIRRKTLKVS